MGSWVSQSYTFDSATSDHEWWHQPVQWTTLDSPVVYSTAPLVFTCHVCACETSAPVCLECLVLIERFKASIAKEELKKLAKEVREAIE